MENFMHHDFLISRLHTVCYVPEDCGTPIHINRPSHGLVLYTGGEDLFDFGEKKLHVRTNELIYLPKHSNYTVRAVSSGHSGGCYAINFDLFSPVSFQPFIFKPKNLSLFLTHFKHAERIWRTQRPPFQMECKATLYSLLSSLQNEYSLSYTTQSLSDLLTPALTYIHEHYTESSLSIPALSNLCRISETYFRRIFKNTQGISPLKYIHSLRITRARDLLASGMYSVSQVCRLSGFQDEAYFSREFKKATGICPSEYMQAAFEDSPETN